MAAQSYQTRLARHFLLSAFCESRRSREKWMAAGLRRFVLLAKPISLHFSSIYSGWFRRRRATGSPPFVGGSGALRSSEASLSSFSSSRSSPPLSVSGRFSRAAPRIPALCIPNHGFVSQTYCLLYFFESNPFQSGDFFSSRKFRKVLWAWNMGSTQDSYLRMTLAEPPAESVPQHNVSAHFSFYDNLLCPL